MYSIIDKRQIQLRGIYIQAYSRLALEQHIIGIWVLAIEN